MTDVSQEKFDRLKALLRDMFQLDRGDLDFGLYRIMNLKAKEVEDFFVNNLPQQVKSVLAGITDEDQADIEQRLRDTRHKLKELRVQDIENVSSVVELKRELAEAQG